MGKLVILRIGDGSFEQGFPVTLRIKDMERGEDQEFNGSLPARTEIRNFLTEWRNHYHSWGREYRWWRQIDVPDDIITNHARNATQDLEESLNSWLESPGVKKITEELLKTVGQLERFMIDTQNVELQRLPWERWRIIRQHGFRAEVAMRSCNIPSKIKLRSPVKILAILSSDENIRLMVDRDFIKNLPGAKTKILENPDWDDLFDPLTSKPWDLIFFAGHSLTQEGGTDAQIWLNNQYCVTIEHLGDSLRVAVKNGLKLAIFNSCDGLGITRKLADLQIYIPYIIVMREPIHNKVAEKFLERFLKEFTTGASLQRAVHAARSYLIGIENYSPNASLLPVIFQHSEASPLFYPSPPLIERLQLVGTTISRNILREIRHIRRKTKLVLIAVITLIIVFVIAILSSVFFSTDCTDVIGISIGEEIMVTKDKNIPIQTKTDIENAFKAHNYQEAGDKLRLYLKDNPNNPELYIYSNNVEAALLRANPIKIAVSVPIGTNQDVAEEILMGVALAQKDINDRDRMNGINRRLLQVIIANDNNNDTLAEKVANLFVRDHTVLAVVGHNASNASNAAAPTYEKNKLVMVSPTSFSYEVASREYVFRMVPDINKFAQIKNFVKLRSDQDYHNLQVVVCFDTGSDAKESHSFVVAFKSDLESHTGGIVNLPCDLTNPSFDLSQVKTINANTFFIAPYINRISAAIKVFNAVHENSNVKYLFGSPTLHSYQTIKLGKGAVEGLILSVPWYDQQLLKRSQDLWKQKVVVDTWRVPRAYDATMVIAEGLQKLSKQGKELNSESLKNILKDTDKFQYFGVTGEVKFDKSGINQNTSSVVFQIQNGQFVRIPS